MTSAYLGCGEWEIYLKDRKEALIFTEDELLDITEAYYPETEMFEEQESEIDRLGAIIEKILAEMEELLERLKKLHEER